MLFWLFIFLRNHVNWHVETGELVAYLLNTRAEGYSRYGCIHILSIVIYVHRGERERDSRLVSHPACTVAAAVFVAALTH
jgi:hypothetical protein